MHAKRESKKPLTNAGKPPGFPFSTHTAVELSCGSYGHLAIPKPIPGTYSDLGKCVKFDCVSECARAPATIRSEKCKNTDKSKKSIKCTKFFLYFASISFIHINEGCRQKSESEQKKRIEKVSFSYNVIISFQLNWILAPTNSETIRKHKIRWVFDSDISGYITLTYIT